MYEMRYEHSFSFFLRFFSFFFDHEAPAFVFPGRYFLLLSEFAFSMMVFIFRALHGTGNGGGLGTLAEKGP